MRTETGRREARTCAAETTVLLLLLLPLLLLLYAVLPLLLLVLDCRGRWHMDERGRFKEDTWWERLTRTTFLRRLRRELMDDLKAVRAIEEQLKKVKNPKVGQIDRQRGTVRPLARRPPTVITQTRDTRDSNSAPWRFVRRE